MEDINVTDLEKAIKGDYLRRRIDALTDEYELLAASGNDSDEASHLELKIARLEHELDELTKVRH